MGSTTADFDIREPAWRRRIHALHLTYYWRTKQGAVMNLGLFEDQIFSFKIKYLENELGDLSFLFQKWMTPYQIYVLTKFE